MREHGCPEEDLFSFLSSKRREDLGYRNILSSMCTPPHPVAARTHAMFLETNLGDPGLFPGTASLEELLVQRLGALMHHPGAGGYATSGGTESNIQAFRIAKKQKPVTSPNVVVPASSHFSFQKACDILLSSLPPDRTCGWARNIGREGQEKGLLTLKALRDFPADMFTTVFIGNSTTRIISGRMVTPRGYQNQARSQEKNDSENGPADKENVQESPLGSSQESLRQSSQEGIRGPKEGSGSNRRDKGRGDAKGTGK